jgi:hypothetical protein
LRYCLQTEKAYWSFAQFFIRWLRRNGTYKIPAVGELHFMLAISEFVFMKVAVVSGRADGAAAQL